MFARLVPSARSSGRTTTRERLVCLALAAAVAAIGTLFWPASAAQAATCSLEEWGKNPVSCADKLAPLNKERENCVKAPSPNAPDSGMGGWFASRPETTKGTLGPFSKFGYAGYSFSTYDVGCVPTVMHPDYKFENTVANGEMMVATAIIGASNAFRERAWEPQSMWGWADDLVETSTKAIYQKVFTVFGVVSLAVVGLYLMWRSRQADLSDALTTAGWAIFVLVIVTAIASWPLWSAHFADGTLVSALGVMHSAVGPPARDLPANECVTGDPSLPKYDPDACRDQRSPALRASDNSTSAVLYRNWLRGTLGTADSDTAKKYGPALLEAKSYRWDEIENIRANPANRQNLINEKNQRWMKVAEQIKQEDPEAYEYLQGTKGMERIGAGFIAVLSALFFSLFDIAASILIILGFLIFRWAVVAAPIIGTVAILRPASGGFKRLANAVVASIFNILIFGIGAAVYLFAVDLIMNTPSLPGWLQVLLVGLCGVVGWLLLRPYRRLTQLGGKDSMGELTSVGSWHRRFFGDVKQVGTAAPNALLGDVSTLDPDEVDERVAGSRRSRRTKERRAESGHEDLATKKNGKPAKGDEKADKTKDDKAADSRAPKEGAPSKTTTQRDSTARPRYDEHPERGQRNGQLVPVFRPSESVPVHRDASAAAHVDASSRRLAKVTDGAEAERADQTAATRRDHLERSR